MRTLMLVAALLTGTAAAQNWTTSEGVTFSVQGCVREKTTVSCSVAGVYGGKAEVTSLTVQRGYARAFAADGSTYVASTAEGGGQSASQYAFNVPFYKNIPTKVTYVFQDVPTTLTSFRGLALADGRVENVRINAALPGVSAAPGVPARASLTTQLFGAATGRVADTAYVVHLVRCVAVGAGASCLAALVMADSVETPGAAGRPESLTPAVMIRIDGVARTGEVVPSLQVVGVTFTNVPVAAR
jgi:hypothetical protein